MRKKFLLRCCALTMAGVLLLGCAGCAKEEQQKGRDSGSNGVVTVYAAEYPKMNPYPETDGFSYDEEEYAAWRETFNMMQASSGAYKEGVWEFTEDTMQEILGDTKGKNKIYSPINIYLALGMLAEITDGNSREQILELLHVAGIEALRQNASDLWLEHYCDDGRLTSKLGASLWLNENVAFVPETLEQVAETYRASSFQGEMGSAEVNKALQEWLNEQTGGLLKDQASNVELDPQTVLALATTLYFQAKWSSTFNESRTVEDIFHAPDGDVTCEFMNASTSGIYYWSDNFAAVRRPFEAGGAMFFFLPDEGVSAEELLEDEEVLSLLENYGTWENKKSLIVNQSVPKFDVVSDLTLNNQLKALGVTDVFDDTISDFTPLTTEIEDIFVSSVQHAARVKIDEEGCEAAAYTVIAMVGSAAPPEDEVDFVLDRPFLFAITGSDGLPLFIGVVNQP